MENKEQSINYIRDALLGLIVGDALGVPVEFESRSTLDQRPISDMIGYGSHHQPPGTWSDDSSLTLCLAEELTKGYDLHNIGRSFVAWLDNGLWTPHGRVFDIGISTRFAIDRLRKGVEPHLAGDWDEMSNGNGSLMRILPLLFYIREYPLLKRYKITKKVSSLTHGHIRSALACFYYLEFARSLCESLKCYDAYEQANRNLKKVVEELEINENEYLKFRRLTSGSIAKLTRDEIRSSGYVIDTLEASIWCILTCNSYQESVLKAINLGDDTDTTGAVTGGLAGIIYGADSIKESWIKKLARIEDIERLLEDYRIKIDK